MPRPRNPTIMSAWKLYMPAPLTAKVELMLLDPTTGKPRHGERARITALLWEDYIARVSAVGEDEKLIIHLPELPFATYALAGHRVSFEELSSFFKKGTST